MATYTAFPGSPDVKSYFPSSAPEEVKSVIKWLTRVYDAQTMTDMAHALKRLVPDVDWTLPFIEFHNAGAMRTWYYLLHYLTYEVFEPTMVEVQPLTGINRTMVTVDGVLTLRPKRSLLVPPSLLLPEAIPVRGQWRVGIHGPLATGEIQFVRISFNNLPNLPSLLRNGFGVVQGGTFAFTEWAWGPLAALLGDDYYNNNAAAQRTSNREFAGWTAGTGGTSGATGGMPGSGLVERAKEAAGAAQQRLAGAGGQAYDSALGGTQQVTSKAHQGVADTATKVQKRAQA